MAGADTVFGPRTQAGLGVTDGNSCGAVYAAGEEMLNRLMTSQYPSAHDRHSRTIRKKSANLAYSDQELRETGVQNLKAYEGGVIKCH
eukprot:scaffold147499_cov86-Cyclotella_meneghiniana.AAC.2